MTIADIRKFRCEEKVIDEISTLLPPEFIDYFINLWKLKFEDEPDYDGFQFCLRSAWERERTKNT